MTVRFWRVAPGAEPAATDTRYPGDAIAVRVEGLAPSEVYTLRLARRHRDTSYAAAVDVVADRDGAIDTRTARPLAGSYDRADPDGLFWSMRADPGRAVPDDLAGFVLTVERGGTVLDTAVLDARAAHPGVRAIAIDRDGVVGALYLPAADAPRPAVVALGGSIGGSDAAAAYAAALANAGFVALALAYFGAPGLPPTLAGVPVEYFARAVRLLRGHPAVAPGPIGVLGRSRGGELALLLGSLMPEIGAVVAHVPSACRWCGTDGPTSPAWTRGGAALPYLRPEGPPSIERGADGRVLCATSPQFIAALDACDPDALERATSNIEATRGPVLVLGADDDQVWPSARLAQLAHERLARRADRDGGGDACVLYRDAGHGATLLPGDPTTDTAFFHPLAGLWLKHGGTAAGNAAAQRAAWPRVIEHLRRALDADRS